MTRMGHDTLCMFAISNFCALWLKKILLSEQSDIETAPTRHVTLPVGHDIHEVLLCKGWYVASGQARQVSKPVDEYVPGPHISRKNLTCYMNVQICSKGKQICSTA